jgi:NADH:ubiquinone oxidoreductase subunit 6 (subunit J)
MIVARVVACVFAVLAILAAFGWLLDQDIAHSLGFLGAALLAFVLSTIPVGRVP